MEQKTGESEGLAKSSGKAIERESDAAAKPKDPGPVVDNVSDPEEDDLDDLDDMLDEFNPAKPEPKAPSISSKPAPPIDPFAGAGDGISDDDFAAQLQAGMASLLGELETSPDMQAQLENIMKEFGGAAAFGEGAGLDAAPASAKEPSRVDVKAEATAGPSTAAPGAEESFQETIKKTMERMRESGDSATAAAASDNSDDILAEMMKAMQASGMDGDGSEEDFSKMLLGMMEQLTNKEILYDPMKELHDKFPEWMQKNTGKVDPADMKRYKEQQVYVDEIVGRFEAKGYSDDNAADREYIVERMQKMQAAGSPPADLVGDMAAAQEAFGAPDEGCAQQ